MGGTVTLNHFSQVYEIEAMNKFTIQNWRVGELGVSFYNPSQYFLNVAVTGDKRHCMNTCSAREGTREPLP